MWNPNDPPQQPPYYGHAPDPRGALPSVRENELEAVTALASFATAAAYAPRAAVTGSDRGNRRSDPPPYDRTVGGAAATADHATHSRTGAAVAPPGHPPRHRDDPSYVNHSEGRYHGNSPELPQRSSSDPSSTTNHSHYSDSDSAPMDSNSNNNNKYQRESNGHNAKSAQSHEDNNKQTNGEEDDTDNEGNGQPGSGGGEDMGAAKSPPQAKPVRGKVLRTPAAAPMEEDDEDEDNNDAAAVSSSTATTVALPPVRGKPEAAARALAAARMASDEEDDDDAVDAEVVEPAEAPPPLPPKKKAKRSASPKKAKASPTSNSSNAKKPSSANRKKVLPSSSRTSSVSSLVSSTTNRRELLLHEVAPSISTAERDNLHALMTQFCRVPLLAEFSRPVALLHPEVMRAYSKVIATPVDLGHICRGIRRNKYQSCRDIRLDMWRVFSNCVKYNSHPSNKEAVPSFVSIALHLREFFNHLWQEYMLPSDRPPTPANATDDERAVYAVQKAAFSRRDRDRKKRLDNSGVLVLSKSFTTKAAALLKEFIDQGGCVDSLDTAKIFGAAAEDTDTEVDIVVQRLVEYQAQLEDVAQSNTNDYTFDAFHEDLRKCYMQDVFEENQSTRHRFATRLDRFFWKQTVPLHEANSRGVTQSSIWGNLAATIWARESSKKAYWPAICLGILPPEEQREGWHQAVTERNEGRLPEKLRGQLMIAKKRCEQAQKRLNLSFFLVEFLGTHEFIWVRETDIIENFDPEDDPNKNIKNAGKKSRSSRSNANNIVGSKTYQTAIQECVWANEEYETVLQDAFEADDENQEDEEDMNYSFNLLAQSDDEADSDESKGYDFNEEDMDISDVDEATYLLTHDGLLDTTTAGRNNAKKRRQAMRKKASQPKKDDATEKRKRSKSRDKKDSSEDKKKDPKEKERLEKKELRELDKRRKRRTKEREKSLKSEARKKTKRRRSTPKSSGETKRTLSHDKRSRATAIVKAYLSRMSKDPDSKSLALSGVMTMPSSMVDSTGLLGMALAFRAAAGELAMPDDSKEFLTKLKPWTAIDADTPKSSADRLANLTKQADLLEKEIDRVRLDTDKRKALIADYIPKRMKTDALVNKNDVSARHNPYKKKVKKPVAKPEKAESPEKSDKVDKDSPSEMEYDEASEKVSGEVVEAHDERSESDSVVAVEAEEVAMDVDASDAAEAGTSTAMEVDPEAEPENSAKD